MVAALVLREKARREIELAGQVQLTFPPRLAPSLPGYEFFSHATAATSVGGDICDFCPPPGDRLAVVIGDVAGMRTPAEMPMAKWSGMLPFCLLREAQPERAVVLLNDRLIQGGIGDRFVTFLMMVLDARTNTVAVANAGFRMPLLVRPVIRERVPLPNDQTGLPLGLMEGVECAALSVTLGPADILVTFTDGVTDSAVSAGTTFELEGVSASVLAGDTAALTPEAIGERLMAAVRNHTDGAAQHDDITVVCFDSLPEGHPEHTHPRPAGVALRVRGGRRGRPPGDRRHRLPGRLRHHRVGRCPAARRHSAVDGPGAVRRPPPRRAGGRILDRPSRRRGAPGGTGGATGLTVRVAVTLAGAG